MEDDRLRRVRPRRGNPADGYARGARGCSLAAMADPRRSRTTWQCDHTKGVRTKTDLSPSVVSLSNNVELLTAIANDIVLRGRLRYQLQSQASARRRAGRHLVVRPFGRTSCER